MIQCVVYILASPRCTRTWRTNIGCDRTTSGRGLSTRIILSNSQWRENTINPHEYNNIYWKFKYKLLQIRFMFKFTKCWSPKDASKDISEFVEAISLTFRTFFSPYKRMPSISALILRTPVWSPAIIGLDFLLTTLVGIAEKRKQLLTCT
jgi:hypothetical protein